MTVQRGSQELSEFFEELYGDESEYDSSDDESEVEEQSKAEPWKSVSQFQKPGVSQQVSMLMFEVW